MAAAVAVGTPDGIPPLPPGYDPSKWKWKPNQDYDPTDIDQRPGEYVDDKGNSISWDPDPHGEHGYRPHWDKTPRKGPKERLNPDGTPFEEFSAQPVPWYKEVVRTIDDATRPVGKWIEDHPREIAIGIGIAIIVGDIITVPSGEGIAGVAMILEGAR
jgi:hypothetical protein